MVQTLFDAMLPARQGEERGRPRIARRRCSTQYGFDRVQHEQIRDGPQGRAASAWPRTACRPARSSRTCSEPIVTDATRAGRSRRYARSAAWRRCSTAKSPWSRWPPGPAAAGPRAPAWSRRCIRSANSAGATARSSKPTWPRAAGSARLAGTPLPHIFTTSYLTHEPTAAFLDAARQLRLRGAAGAFRAANPSACASIPTVRDLRFAWEEMPQQMLDEQQQKVRDSLRAALIGWARASRRSQRLHRQPAAAMPAPGRPLV